MLLRVPVMLGVWATKTTQCMGMLALYDVCMHAVVASKHRRRGGHTFCAGYSRRPISSFKHSAAVSYAHVERFVLERKLRHTCRFDFIKQVPPPTPHYSGPSDISSAKSVLSDI